VAGAAGLAGEGGVAAAGGAAVLAGGFGMYSGPGWPQPATAAAAAVPRMSANEGFTIRITV
jgi:hypothetical protein